MLRRKTIMSILILLPLYLWSWGNDVVIDAMRSSSNQYPAGYDITWGDRSDMVVGIGFNTSDNTAYVYLYNSNDMGNTWNHVATAQWNETKISGIQLLESPPYLIVLWVGMGNEIALTIHNRENLNNYIGTIVTEPDSIVDARIVSLQKGDIKNIFVGLVTRDTISNTDILKAYKSENYGPFQQIFVQYFTNNSSFLFLKDMDGVIKNDTTILYLTLENLDRSNNKASLSFKILAEDTLGNVTTRAIGYPLQFGSPLNSSLGVSGSYALTLLQTDNDLKYVFASDYFNQSGRYDFPYNSADSVEWGPFVKGWDNNEDNGFHIIFSRGNITYGSKLYYSEAVVSGNTVQFSNPILLSDEIPVCKTPYNFQSNYYNPKIATLMDEYLPVVIWPQDFWHIFYGSPFYDSTYFAIDKIEEVRIEEKSNQNAKFFSISVRSGIINLNFESTTEKAFIGEIFNIEGKLMESFYIPTGVKSLNLEAKKLKKGTYFFVIKDSNSFISTKRFLTW